MKIVPTHRCMRSPRLTTKQSGLGGTSSQLPSCRICRPGTLSVAKIVQMPQSVCAPAKAEGRHESSISSRPDEVALHPSACKAKDKDACCCSAPAPKTPASSSDFSEV